MKIKEINIIQFGKFKDRVWRLDEGMNVIFGDNESGKSTLLAFIKFALYGVARKNPNILVGERERAVSWNIGIAAGSLTLADADGKLYRIERSGREGARGTYADKARIIDLESGEEVFSGEVPGEHFLGINAQSYDSMCNIKQLECVSVGRDAVKNVIDNLLSSGDENMNIQTAIKALDLERRRLLHANGRGGLVFDTESELEKLKSEHRSAVIFENECIKNRDELERVKISLERSQKEHEMLQRLCDLHDDIVRLHKFEHLRELSENKKSLANELANLKINARLNTENASFEMLAKTSAASDALEKSRAALACAEDEVRNAQNALDALHFDNEEILAGLIEEYGSPKGALAFLGAKKKKRSSSAFLFASFGIAGAVLLALAATLIFGLSNIAGGITVAFIGASISAAAAVFFRQKKIAEREIDAFGKYLPKDFTVNGEEELLSELEGYSLSISERSRASNNLEAAKFRLQMAREAFDSDLSGAKSILFATGADFVEGDEEKALKESAEKIRTYLESKTELEEKLRESAAVHSSLSRELERFSESDIRAHINSDIEEKIKNTSFDELKNKRDAALRSTNQYSQYKAGIERSLAMSSGKRQSTEIYPEIEAQSELLAKQRLRLDAVKLAMDTINAASAELKSDITPQIRSCAEQNLSEMTAGKYSELFIDENMSLSVFADGATRPIDSLSRGSLDVAYFSVRLALLDTLLGGKEPPIYADEILSQLDDGRARGVVSALAEYAKRAQCVLFTCQRRDLELARDACDANVIDLNTDMQGA